jgi:hypothetical protein
MKILAILAAAVCILVTGSWSALASSHTGTSTASSFITLRLPLGTERPGHIQLRQIRIPLQTGATATPTGTAVSGTPTPTPTATATNTYPDPVTILQNFAQVYGSIRSAHVGLITTAEKPSVEKLTIDGEGDATCSGPALKLTVNASDVLEGTSQKATVKATFVQVKNKTEIKTSTKSSKWTAVKNPDNVGIFGKKAVTQDGSGFPYPIDNPLACPSASSGGGGSSGITDVSKDVVNLGPDTFQGNPVWHIHFVDVRTDTSGNSIELVDDFFIGQDHYLPYDLEQTFNDTADGITILEKQVTTKVGEKIKIKYHKLGTK